MDQASTLRYMSKMNENTNSSQQKRDKQIMVMAITSGKGGVGKTNIVANLAISLSMLNRRVVVFDADLGLANLDVLLGLIPKYNLKDVLIGKKSFSEIIVEGPKGIKIIPASSGIQELSALTDEQRLRLLSEFDQFDENIDILLIDTAAGISSNVMYFNVAAQEIIVIAAPEPTSITDAYALMKVLSINYGEKYFRLIVNSVKDEKEGKEVFKKLSVAADRFLDISIDYLGSIPFDESVTKAVRQQKALVELYPSSKAGRSFAALAKSISKISPRTHPKGNIQFFWQQILQNHMNLKKE
ncbi:MAG TPA: MinD/ParA family protein [Nitrospinota bacterium]|nr:MinD/ParA family protein [Nitrospinota bacterium]